jgi:manganese transport protein
MAPPPPTLGPPALEGASADGSGVALPEGVAIESPLEGLLKKGRLRATLAMLGPAFVAAVAYVDPGNFATNIQGGAKYGFLLLWVVLVANLTAMLIQYLSAKLGIATDRNLPEMCRERFPRWTSWGLWLQAEVMAMSTDIAELLGAALGLNLLFGVPLFTAGVISGLIAFAILSLQSAATAASRWRSRGCSGSCSRASCTRRFGSGRPRTRRWAA